MNNPGTIVAGLADWVGRHPYPRAVFAEVGLGPPVLTRPQPLVEIFMVMHGSCVLEIGDRAVALGPGHIALINAHLGNRARACEHGFRYACISLPMDDTVLRRHPLLAVGQAREFAELIASAHEVALLTHAPPAPLAALGGKAALLRFLLLAHNEFSDVGSPAASDPRLARALAWAHEHHRDPDLTVEDLARAAKISSEHLGRLCQRACGTSPMQYVLRLRLEHARGLLAKTAMGVKEVAALVGFRDAGYFSRRFHRAMGFPPSRASRLTSRTEVRRRPACRPDGVQTQTANSRNHPSRNT